MTSWRDATTPLKTPLQPGDKAFVFIYSLNNIFSIREVEIAPALQTKEHFIDVIIKGEAISTTDEPKHKIGKRINYPENLIKSPKHVRFVLKKYGKNLIRNIFEGMF